MDPSRLSAALLRLLLQDQIGFNRFLASAAHSLGLGVGLKNLVELPSLHTHFDWCAPPSTAR